MLNQHTSDEWHDSTAAWAQENVRPFIAQGCDQQGRHKPTIEPDPVNAVMGMDDDYSAADSEQSQFITVVLVIAVWVLALPAAWFGVAHLFKTLVEAAP